MAEALKDALVRLGIPEEDINRVMHVEVRISPDEERLAEMVGRGQVQLLNGAKTSTTTWQVRVEPAKKGS